MTDQRVSVSAEALEHLAARDAAHYRNAVDCAQCREIHEALTWTGPANTKRVEVAVVVLPDGRWEAVGSSDGVGDAACLDDHLGCCIEGLGEDGAHFLMSADVPLPVRVEGEVKPCS